MTPPPPSWHSRCPPPPPTSAYPEGYQTLKVPPPLPSRHSRCHKLPKWRMPRRRGSSPTADQPYIVDYYDQKERPRKEFRPHGSLAVHCLREGLSIDKLMDTATFHTTRKNALVKNSGHTVRWQNNAYVKEGRSTGSWTRHRGMANVVVDARGRRTIRTSSITTAPK